MMNFNSVMINKANDELISQLASFNSTFMTITVFLRNKTTLSNCLDEKLLSYQFVL